MVRRLSTFDIQPNPAKEGQTVTISFTYPEDRATVTLRLVNWEESETISLVVEVRGKKGAGKWVVPKGWGPSLFVSHEVFVTEAIGVIP